MWWKSLVVALLVLPPLAYVAGTLHSPSTTPERRPALVLDSDVPPVARTEPEVTLDRRPQPPPRRTGDDRAEGGSMRSDDDDRDDRDDRDDGDDRGDEGLTVVRPAPQQAGGDDDAGSDDDEDDRGPRGSDDDDDRGDDSRDDSRDDDD